MARLAKRAIKNTKRFNTRNNTKQLWHLLRQHQTSLASCCRRYRGWYIYRFEFLVALRAKSATKISGSEHFEEYERTRIWRKER